MTRIPIFLVLLTLAERGAQHSLDWKNFVEKSRGVQRVHLLPSYDDVNYTCYNWRDRRVQPSTSVCNGINECLNRMEDDESPHLCAQDLTTDLQLKESSASNTTVHLAWTRPPIWQNMPLDSGSNGKMKLAGYFLTGISRRQVFKNIIDYGLLEYVVSNLNPGTKYDIILRPFYMDDIPGSSQYRIGPASAIQPQTLASAPEAPLRVDVVSAGQRTVVIKVIDPFLWNGSPVGYRVKWLPKQRPDGSGEDFYKIPSSRHSETFNITLNLEPGESYQVFVFAVNTDNTKATYEGPATTTHVGTTPMEPTAVFANIIAPGSVMVGWKSRGASSYFLITAELPSYERTTLNIDSHTYKEAEHRVVVDLISSKPAQRHHSNFYPAMPRDLNKNEVIVAACSVTECSSGVAARVAESFLGPPRVSITRAFSENSTSFQVDWTLSDTSETLYDDFNIRYYEDPLHFRDINTYKKSLAVSGLSPGTTYRIEVRARHRNQNGGTSLGHAARTRIRTWTLVPQKPELTKKSVGSDFVVASWRFNKSIVTHFQISKEDGVWTNCTSGENCTVDAVALQSPALRTGFITFTSLVPHTNYSFSLRGCNEHGCGEGDTFETRTRLSEPSAPLNLNATSEPDDAVKIVWDSPAESNGPLNGYMVSWECSPGVIWSFITNDTVATYQGAIKQGKSCNISVAGFNLDEQGNILLGRSDNVSFP